MDNDQYLNVPTGEHSPDKGWSRHASISVYEATCDVCGETSPVLATNSSDMEYGDVLICQECANKAFRDFLQAAAQE